MKCIKTILIIILAAFIGGTFGFTSLSRTPNASYPVPSIDNFNGEILHEMDRLIFPSLNACTSSINNAGNVNESTSTKAQAPQGPVDFMISDSDLTVITYGGHPGDPVFFKVRVHNNTPDTGSCGGSTVRFIMNGRIIDEVPFFLDSGVAYKDVNARLFLPEGEYSSLAENQQVAVQVQAIVDPYNKTLETNEDNNNAASQFMVKGVHQVSLHGINPGITIDVSGLWAWSTKNDAPNDKISAVVPGQTLHLKARLRYTGAANNDDINIKFILNGIVIKDFNRQIVRPSTSGYLDVAAEYYAPIYATGLFDFMVVLSNGSQARIKIPVIGWDVGINAGDLHWSGETVAVPGKNIFLKAVIKNVTSMRFPFDSNKIAYRVLIDGTIFYEDDLFLFYDSINPNIPAYKVPEGRITPIQCTIILDPYNQLEESDETNNMATITIPIQNTSTAGPDFSISASGLSYISKPLLPGSQVKLSAAILNNSKIYLSKDLRVLFKINGNIIPGGDFKVNKSFLRPLQYYLTTRDWNVPQNLPANSVFEVVIDPAAEFTGENATDNKASIILDTCKPDLEVTADCLSWLPLDPKAGQLLTLYAGVRNNGITSATNCIARFFIDGSFVGDSSPILLIPGASGAVASQQWQVPAAPELAPIAWNTLKGETGKLPLPPGTTKDYKFKVRVDPDNQIEEINENNNISDEKNLTVYVPYTKGVVYIRIFDGLGNLSDADVELKTAGGTTAKALSAEDGWCTFTGVPFGSYTVTVKKQKYEDRIFESQTIEGRLINYLDLQLIRKSQYPYFSATASILEGITALTVDFNCDFLDTDRTDLDFMYEWTDGNDLIGVSKSFNYIFVEPKIHTVNLNVRNQDYTIVFTTSFNIKVNPPVISIINGGRKIVSLGSIFVDNPAKYDIDKDGINQAWEDVAMNAINPLFELDEGEDWLKKENNSNKVVNFVMVSPYPSIANRKYILFTYGITWSKDYGRYTDITRSLFGHKGDIEKVVMAWEVIDDKNLGLKWVFTSAHTNERTDHSGVWNATGKTLNIGKAVLCPDDHMCEALEFNNNILKFYVSEDKHAIYPTESCGESVVLIFFPGIPIPVIPFFIPPWLGREDVGTDEDGKNEYWFICYNIGEIGAPLIDDIGDIFPNERVWSGNIYNPGRFYGGLGTNDGIGSIGGNLSGDPPNLLKSVLDGNEPDSCS